MTENKLFFEQYDDQEINLIMRDLSIHEKLDVKELFKNYKKSELSRKKKHKTNADKIISENKKRIEELNKSRDDERLEYFNNLETLSPAILNEISHFKTKYGKNRMKMKLLKIAYTKNISKYMINLYLQVLSNSYSNKAETKLMSRITRQMKKIDYKRIQFEHLSNELSPLDFYNDYEKKLDSWQIKTLSCIDKGQSVLVCAPTSCGKTWLSIYPGIIGKRVLFVVPTTALVYQVSALFTKFGASICMISSDFSYGNPDNNVIIGTPKDIEDKLPVLGTNFDIIVYDEIHNLSNPIFGNFYERLVKIFKDIQILALSATIGNPRKLIKWFDDISNRKMTLITYSTRFLNLQRHLFHTNSLHKIHPISCLTIEDINPVFLLNNLPMTPYDCIVLYDALSETFNDEVSHLDVNKVFTEDNTRLSLDDARTYEVLLKEELIKLKEKYPEKIQNLLKKYYIQEPITENINLYNLFKQIKHNNLTPCIVFQQNTTYCKDIFTKLVGYLEKLEELNYPYHYVNLEYAEECYKNAIEEKAKYKKTIKFDKDFVGNKTEALEEMLDKKWESLTNQFGQKWDIQYKKQIAAIKKTSYSDKIKSIQLSNLKKEYINFTSTLTLKHVDIFQKHPDFCLNTSSPMTANKIREIRNTIRKKLQITVSYTNVFMQGLKRGIGIYTVDMPPVYNMIVQQLAQTGTLGYVIADVSLALGINMPFRSSCILGYNDSVNFEIDNYLQMIGRSGRRGMDSEGHIIYANVDWKNLMKGELSEINSKYKNIENYNILQKLNPSFNELSNKVYSNILDPIYKEKQCVIRNTTYSEETKNILLWKLRKYNHCIEYFINNLLDTEMEYRIAINSNTTIKLLTYLSTIFIDQPSDVEAYIKSNQVSEFTKYTKNILLFNKLPEDNYEYIKKLTELLCVIRDIHNVISDDEGDYYLFLTKHLKNLFNTLKNIILQSNILND